MMDGRGDDGEEVANECEDVCSKVGEFSEK